MISIITAVHNGLAVNELFVESLRKYTHFPYELIIIDNNSSDGSAEYFRSQGAKVISNKENYSYPYTQNQGIKEAKYDVFAFLNNDIIVSPDWDKRILQAADANGLEVLTVCGIERLESPAETQKIRRRWKAIKNILSVLGYNKGIFRLMHKLMYGSWEAFNDKRFKKFGTKVVEGFVGNSVIMKRSAIDKVGLWDERIQAADFDLYVRTKKRALENGDIRPVSIALGVFNHHFIRITVRSKPSPFADKDKLISLDEKWGNEALKKYLADNVST